MVFVVPKEKSGFSPGEHPHSKENLKPRETMYEENKKRRYVMATDPGWEGFKAIAKELGISASELIERIGRGILRVEE